MAQALLNQKVGDEVEFEIHGARHRHRIESIEAAKMAPATPSTEQSASTPPQQ
jgi:hypothetical protein